MIVEKFGMDRSGAHVFLVTHRFERAPDGQLLHSVDGQPRATVPPGSWEQYVELYPDCRPVVDSLRRKPGK